MNKIMIKSVSVIVSLFLLPIVSFADPTTTVTMNVKLKKGFKGVDKAPCFKARSVHYCYRSGTGKTQVKKAYGGFRDKIHLTEDSGDLAGILSADSTCHKMIKAGVTLTKDKPNLTIKVTADSIKRSLGGDPYLMVSDCSAVPSR